MRLATVVQLARSRTPADRSRVRLTTAAFALSGALVLDALRIARLGKGELSYELYSNYIAESGLRPGLIAILIILAALTAGLAVQALRLGTAARERRLTALRLAGASRKQVRRLSVVDAALAGLAGGILPGPVYLGLSLIFGRLPLITRILPGAVPMDGLLWVPVIAVMTAAGAVLGLLHRDGPASRQPQSAAQRRTGIIAGPVIIALGLFTTPYLGYVGSTIMVGGIALLFLSTSGIWFGWLGRQLQRSGDPVNVLTGARLATDSRPTARICMLLGCCGFLVGSMANGIAEVLAADEIDSDGFYTTGFGLTIVGLVLVVLTAMAALIVGVADQLVDQRRQLASLTAMGVDLPFLRRLVRRQLTVVAAPTLAGGLFLGTAIGVNRLIGAATEPVDTLLLAAVLTAAGWIFGHLGGAAAGFLLRNQLRDALDPENLRAA